MSTITINDDSGSLSITADLSQGAVTVSAPAQADTITVAAPGPTGPKGDTGAVSPSLQDLANQAALYAQQAETATSGYEKFPLTANPQVLATVDAANAILELTGAGVNGQVVDLPAASRSMIILNSTTGGFAVAIAMTGGTAQVSLQPGEAMPIYCDGLTGVYAAGAAIKRTTSAARYVVAPSWPTPLSTDNSTSGATTAFVVAQINALIAAAPGALNTLNELATALGDDPNFATTVTNNLATKLAKAGDTMTGSLTIAYSNAFAVLNDTSGTNSAGLYLQNAGVNQWRVTKDSSQNFTIARYVSGVITDSPIVIAPSTGLVTMTQRPKFAGNLAWDAGNLNPAIYLPLAGGTMTGGLNLAYASASISVSDTSGTGQARVNFNNNGVLTWGMLLQSSDNTWRLNRYNSGTLVDAPIQVYNTTGAVALSARPTFAGNAAWDAGNFTPGNYAALAASNTFSAAQTIAYAGATALLNDTSGTNQFGYGYQSGGTPCWAMWVATGRNWLLQRYVSGVATDNPISVSNATGVTSFTQRPSWAGYTPWDSNNLNPALYAPIAGATFTSTLGISSGTNNASFILNANAGVYRDVIYNTAGSNRWVQGVSNEAESGSNAGSNWFLSRYNDAGAYVENVISVNRATGAMAFGTGGLTIGGSVGITGSSLTLSNATPAMYINAPAVANRLISFQTNAVNRWQVGADSTTEQGGGTNTGSNFVLARMSDTGVYIDEPFGVSRQTGIAWFTNQLQVSGGLKFSDGTTLNTGTVAFTGGTVAGATSFTSSTATTFSVRPTFNGATAWDSANFNPASYLPLTGGTLSGAAIISSGSNAAGLTLISASTYSPLLTLNANGYAPKIRANSTASQIEFVNSANSAVPTTLTDAGHLTTAGALISTGFDTSGGGQIRLHSGTTYGVMFRNDGGSFYILSTASGSPAGSFNSLRPFYYNLASGAVTVDGSGAGTTFGGAMAIGGAVTMTGQSTFVTSPLACNDAQNQSLAAIQVRNNSGTGDANVAAVAYLCQSQYGILQHLRPDGYFGIGGWSSPAWRWYSDPSGNMVASGNVTAYSDPRLKERFKRIEKPLDILKALDGGTFYWREGFKHTSIKAGKRDYGILADQVEKVMPEIVAESIDIEGQSYRTVAYEKLVPVLIEGIKSLDIKYARKVRALEKRIRELEKTQ